MQATKIVIAVCMAMTAFAGVASAHGPYNVTKGALSPGTADISGVAVIGAAVCQNAAAAALLFCGGGGLGAFIDVSRDADPTTEAPLECGLKEAPFGVNPAQCGVNHPNGQHHHHPFATGTCTVSTTPPVLGTDFFWSCGVDRNNDGIVTDANVCDIEDTTARGAGPPPHVTLGLVTLHEECTGEAATSNHPESHADDWVNGCYRHAFTGPTPCSTMGNSDSRPFCFQDNVRGFTDIETDDSGLPSQDISAFNQHVSPVEHGDGWSEVVFFVGAQVPNTASAAGATNVNLVIVGAASCGPATGGLVSAHGTGGNPDTDGNGRNTPECSDSIDNDGDSTVDEADPTCLNGPGGTYNANGNE